MKILITPTSMTPDKDIPALKRLKDFADEIVFNPTGKPLEGDLLTELLSGCDGYLAGVDYITKEVLEKCPQLKCISRYGSGFDRVDLDAARTQGIAVATTPGTNSQAVAELALGMMFCLARQIPYLHKETAEGRWVRSNGTQLYGKTLGIVGLGAIGKRLAKMCSGISMKILAYDPFINEEYCRTEGIESCTLTELLNRSDFVSLHLPLNSSTRHIIDADAISSMKKGAFLINASRGGIVDEEAAYAALQSGQLGGLGLDAFEQEPPEVSPLFGLENVVLTPHTGAHTAEATAAMADMAVDNLIAVLSGNECSYVINR